MRTCTLLALCLVAATACSHKSRPPAATGAVAGDAAIVSTSPFAAESAVALSRETVLEFSAPIVPGDVTPETVNAWVGDSQLAARLHVGRDARRVTLFYPQHLPAHQEVRVVVEGDRLRAQNGRPLDADADGTVGGRLELRFQTLDLTRSPGTDVCGRVFASDLAAGGNEPLAGVEILLDGLPEVNARTDAMGNFCLRDVPAGRIFVHVDGTAASNAPEGFYYPNVGKAWETIAGRVTSVGTIHLPAVSLATLQPTSTTADTEIRMATAQIERVADPHLRALLAAVKLTVPADSLFRDDGTRGGLAGIAPVDPDRLPGTLPADLHFSLVITVQTDGASNFDVPAPICFPNVEGLPAGTKSALWSFNHDTGRFEIVGPMTVSSDGTLICTDPGVGIRAPGWHGSLAGSWLLSLLPLDCQEGSCAQRQNCSLARKLLSVGQRTFGCVGGFTGGLRRAAGCAFGVAAKSFDVAQAGADYHRALGTGQQLGTLATLAARVRGAVGAVTGFASCAAREFSPYRALRDCIGAATAATDALCQAGGIGPHVPEGCARNDGVSAWISGICERSARITADLNALDAGVRLIERVATGEASWHGVVFSAAALIDRIHRRLELESRGMTAAEVDELRTALEPLQARMDEIRADLARVERDMESIRQAQERIGAMLDEIERHLEGSPRPGTYRYRLEAEPRLRGAADAPGRPAIQLGATNDQGVVSLNGMPDAEYLFTLFDVARNRIGRSRGHTGANGSRTVLGRIAFEDAALLADSDGDGLADEAEALFRTEPDNRDSDGDGVDDRTEILAGTDPTDGQHPGSIGRLDTPSPARDVCVRDGTAVIAGDGGEVCLANVYRGMAPAKVSTLALGRAAERIACGDGWLAAAVGPDGVVIADLRTPARPVIAHRLRPPGDATAVDIAGTTAYVGTTAGWILAIDLPSGAVLAQATTVRGTLRQEDAIVDLTVAGAYVYAIDQDNLHTLPLLAPTFAVTHTVTARHSSSPIRRLFADADTLYVVKLDGFATWSLANPAQPALIRNNDSSERGWKQLVLDGSGRGVAAVGTTPRLNDGPHGASVWDLSRPGANFVLQLPNPGKARAVQLYSGLAYVADHDRGLGVFRYSEVDRVGIAPSLILATNAASGQIEAGKPLQVRARAIDDDHVSHVDLYIDGDRAATAATYPFEFLRRTPSAPGTMTIRARAVDMAGNATVTAPLTLSITPDATPPRVVRLTPSESGSVAPAPRVALTAVFDEPLRPSSVHAGTFRLLRNGVAVTPLAVQYREEASLALLEFAATTEGSYRAELTGGITDVAGNALAPRAWSFFVETVEPGLRLQMFNEFDWTNVRAFFAGRAPVTFTLRTSAGTTMTAVTTAPTLDFADAAGRWFAHNGGNGVWDGGTALAPRGDDFSIEMPNDTFGALLEGYLIVPRSGTVELRVSIDDGFVLDLGPHHIEFGDGRLHDTTIDLPVLQLEAGRLPLRVAFYDGFSSARMRFFAIGGDVFPVTGRAIASEFFVHRR